MNFSKTKKIARAQRALFAHISEDNLLDELERVKSPKQCLRNILICKKFASACRLQSSGDLKAHCSFLARFPSSVSLIECLYKLPNFRFRFLAIWRDVKRQIP